MDRINGDFTPAQAAVSDLRKAMSGKVVTPTDAAYAGARRLWNGAVELFPAAFARCMTADDVRTAINVARRHNVKLTVRGGGHDWAGRSLCQNGIVVDLSAMRQVEVDAERHIATVAAGATARDVLSAAAHHGLVAVTGNCGDVGMAGLTLGGGYGPLSSRYGLATDNLLSAEVVLADGTVVTANDQDHPDLYWALRGGGGNFGVVTKIQVALHPLREVLAGVILFSWHEAEAVLRGYAEVMASAPDELGASAGLVPMPDGQPAVFLAPLWSGERGDGGDAIGALEHLGHSRCTQIAPMHYAEAVAMFDAHGKRGHNYFIRTRSLPILTSQAIAGIAAAGQGRTSPLSMMVLHHLHGVATRVPSAATAFHLRREHYLFEAISAWPPGTDDRQRAAHRDWAHALSGVLGQFALPGGYANLLGPTDTDQIAGAYGLNTERLLAVKSKFDPDGTFTAIPLPLQADPSGSRAFEGTLS